MNTEWIPVCRHTTEHIGSVMWPLEIQGDQPHAAVAVCHRAECHEAAKERVRSITDVRGVFAAFRRD